MSSSGAKEKKNKNKTQRSFNSGCLGMDCCVQMHKSCTFQGEPRNIADDPPSIDLFALEGGNKTAACIRLGFGKVPRVVYRSDRRGQRVCVSVWLTAFTCATRRTETRR